MTENKTKEETVIELDVFICADRKIDEEDVVAKIMGSLADQIGINIIISPLSQTIERKAQQYADQQTARYRELLTEIDRALYVGEDLKEEDILGFYMRVVQTIKDEIKEALSQ